MKAIYIFFHFSKKKSDVRHGPEVDPLGAKELRKNKPNSDPKSDPKIELGPWRINTLKTLIKRFLNESKKKI